MRASVCDHWTQRKVTVDAEKSDGKKIKLTYLLTYNLASVGGPKCPGQSPIDVKSDEAIQI